MKTYHGYTDNMNELMATYPMFGEFQPTNSCIKIRHIWVFPCNGIFPSNLYFSIYAHKWYLSYMDNTPNLKNKYWIFKQLLFDFKLDFSSEAFILTYLYLRHKSKAVPHSIFCTKYWFTTVTEKRQMDNSCNPGMPMLLNDLSQI